jgi:hypothetical protein
VPNEERAEAARTVARELGDTLFEKQMSYGDSGAIALGVWQARLAQYRYARHGRFDDVLKIMAGHPDEEAFYVVPASLIAHIPRLTRVDDRINRIISNPAGDRMGEDPWRDMAGDAIIGVIMPRVQRPEPEPDNPYRDMDLAGEIVCGHVHPQHGVCERKPGHVEAGHPEHRRVHAGGTLRWMNEHDTITRQDTYTHGYEPSEADGPPTMREEP